MRPFGCLVTILNTLDHLSKFDGKSDEGFFVGYSMNSKAFRVFNSRTKTVEENVHIRFSENTPNIIGSGPDWLFDIDALTRTMNYEPMVVDYILLPLWTADPPFSQDPKSSHDDGFKPSSDDEKKSTNNVNTANSTINVASTNEDNELPFDLDMPALEDVGTFDFLNEDEDDDAMDDINNLDTTIQGIVIRNKARLVAQGHIKEEGINYDEVFAYVARIEAIRLFLAYASYKDFVVYQMDVKSAFLYGKVKEEVYVCQPPGFEDPDFPNRVYKVEKALYGLHEAPKACQDKYVAKILKNFGFIEVKNASTPMETQKPLLKDEVGKEVDVHTYRLMIGSLMYLTSSIPDIMFAMCACARYQVNPKVSHLHAVKRIFRYLKDQPKLGLWYLKDSPFVLVAYTNSDYAGASLDRKSTTKGCQFL
nr:hypothetical protein [Tanacetum cinerariifolium]